MLGVKNWNDGATGPIKKLGDVFSRLDTIHQRDGRTDGHVATAKTTLSGVARVKAVYVRQSDPKEMAETQNPYILVTYV